MEKSKGPVDRKIKDPAFGQRMHSACDASPHVPTMNYGRLTWIQQALQTKFGRKVSVESVRKWVNGEARPRPATLTQIAEVLQVDEAWLSLGVQQDMSPRERKVRDATVDGVVNVLAGFVQMGGGYPAFPEPGDERAKREYIQMYAIIKGANYAFNVSLAKPLDDGGYRFRVPTTHENIFVIGAIEREGFAVEFIELSSDTIDEMGSTKGGYIDVALDETAVAQRQIKSFSERL